MANGGLKGKIEKIAIDATKGYIQSVGFLRKNQNNCANMGLITGYKDGQYEVTMTDGSVITAAPGGIRPIGTDGAVLIIDGIIAG